MKCFALSLGVLLWSGVAQAGWELKVTNMKTYETRIFNPPGHVDFVIPGLDNQREAKCEVSNVDRDEKHLQTVSINCKFGGDYGTVVVASCNAKFSPMKNLLQRAEMAVVSKGRVFNIKLSNKFCN